MTNLIYDKFVIFCRWAACFLLIFMIAAESSVFAQEQTAASVNSGKKILFIGDSVTDGNWAGGGAEEKRKQRLGDLNHIYGHSFVYLCAAHYMGVYPERNYQFYNRGISGNTLKDLEARWQEDAIDLDPDVMTVLVGINDVNHYLQKRDTFFTIPEWEARYSSLIERSLEKNPDIRIVLCTPFTQRGDYKGTTYEQRKWWIDRCDEVVIRLAQKYDVQLLSFDKLFDSMLTSYKEVPSSYWVWDGIHPTAAGHQRMADLWIETMDVFMK